MAKTPKTPEDYERLIAAERENFKATVFFRSFFSYLFLILCITRKHPFEQQ